MTKLPLDESTQLWRQTRTFRELCDLTARFVLGEISFQPGWQAEELDDESDPLVPYLAAFNRAGFLTTCSQPGDPFGPGFDGHCSRQRAFVCGFAQEETARRIQAGLLFTDLYVSIYSPDKEEGFRVPCVVRGGQPYLWAGHAVFGAFDCFEPHSGVQALAELEQAWFVNVIDLQWGRREHLWSQLALILCPSR